MVDSAFDPSKHLIQLRGRGGDSDYLPISARVEWFRSEYPDGRIETTHITLSDQIAVFRADVTVYKDGEIRGRATGHGSETPKDFADFIEKSETKAIGRALAALGFGTQFVGDEGDRIADAPVDRPQTRPEARQRTEPPPRGNAIPKTSGMDMGAEIVADFFTAIQHAKTGEELAAIGHKIGDAGISDDGLRAAYAVRRVAFASTA